MLMRSLTTCQAQSEPQQEHRAPASLADIREAEIRESLHVPSLLSQVKFSSVWT
jgi:hypothetical protein